MPPEERVFDEGMFHDYVVAHGDGPPTEKAYHKGREWFGQGDPYSTIAHSVVYHGWVKGDKCDTRRNQ